MKIDPRVSELADPEIWHFPLTLLVVLTTLSRYRVRCDRLFISLFVFYCLLIFHTPVNAAAAAAAAAAVDDVT